MKHRVAVAFSLFTAAFAVEASAQVPAGGEFRVNTYTTGGQRYSAVASDAAGNFVVVWSSPAQDGSDWGVFAQRYDAAGAVRGGEFQVNTYTSGRQYRPSVALDGAGHSVVVWQSRTQDGSGEGIFAQRYDAAGAKWGGEFQVNTYTTGGQFGPAISSDAVGNFVVAWDSYSQDGSLEGIFAQRYDAAGAKRGGELRVNTYTTGGQFGPAISSDAVGNFVVAWDSYSQDGSRHGVFAQRYDAAGVTRGGEFRVNTYTTSAQFGPAISCDAVGNFVVAWDSYNQDGSMDGVFAQRYDAAGVTRGGEFRVNTYSTGQQRQASVSSDAAGNSVVVWEGSTQGESEGVVGQRFGGLRPADLAVDPTGNGVLEADEIAEVMPSWTNWNGATQSFGGLVSDLSGPPGAGVGYVLRDAIGNYYTVANGSTAQCGDCYEVQVQQTGARPATHWDATLTEILTPDALGETKPWSLHIGESFADVPKMSGYYRFIETLLHKGVAGGCTATTYCPSTSATRGQMAVFALVGKEGSTYSPPACGTTPMFTDVPVTSPYCKWVEELVRRGIAGGCGGGHYCPGNVVTRGQMPIFMLKTLDPTIDPPTCGTPMFADVPAASPYCKWIEELARRGVVSGCGGGNYCPASPVTRGQMGVFISSTFGLTLYGP
jgi:hypothetical protein